MSGPITNMPIYSVNGGPLGSGIGPIDVAKTVFQNELVTEAHQGLIKAANLVPYFGAPAGGFKAVADEFRFVDRFQFPKAYEGNSAYLGQRILGLAIEKDDWLWTTILPIQTASTLNYEWDLIVFEESAFEKVPEEGTGRVMSSSAQRNGVTLVRRGKAIFLEHGFWKTPAGQQHYERQTQQVGNAAANTMSFDALITLVNQREHDIKMTFNKNMSGELLYDEYITSFASWQKTSGAAEQTFSRAKELIQYRTGSLPNFAIVPRGCENLMKGAINSDKLDYNKVGPIAEGRRLQIYNTDLSNFANIPVYKARAYKNHIGGQLNFDVLKRPRVVGEFAVMEPLRPNHPIYNKTFPQPYKYSSDHRSVRILDMKIDSLRTITLKEASKSFFIYDSDPVTGKEDYITGSNPKNSPNVVQGRTQVETPFEHPGYHGITKNIVFGETPEEFLSDDTFKLMVTQLYQKSWVGGVSTPFFTEFTNNSFFKRGNLGKLAYVGSVMVGYPAAATAATATQPAQEARQIYGVFQYDGGLNNVNVVTRGLGDIGTSTRKLTESEILQKLSESGSGNYASSFLSRLDNKDKELFLDRASSILTSNSAVKENLIDPLASICNLTGTQKEQKNQETKLRGLLLEPSTTIPTRAKVDEVVASNNGNLHGLGFYSSNEINKIQSETGSNFVTLRDFTGSDQSIQNFIELKVAENHLLEHTSGLKEIKHNLQDLTNNFVIATGLGLSKLKDVSNIKDLEKRYIKISSSGYSQEEKEVAFHLLFQWMNKTFMDFLIDNDIFFPYRVLLLRPFVMFETCTVIIGIGGDSLGHVFVKDPDAMLADNATDKTHLIFVTFYMKSAVTAPHQLNIIDDVAISDYHCNGSTRFITRDEFSDFEANSWECFNENDRAGSLYVLLAPYEQYNPVPSRFNLNKRWPHESYSDPPHIRFHDNELLERYLSKCVPEPHVKDWDDTVVPRGNRTLVQMSQICYNPVSEAFDAYIYTTKSYLGPNGIYDGVINDLKSGVMIIKEQNLSQKTNFYSL